MTAALDDVTEKSPLKVIDGNCNAWRSDGSGLLCANRAGKGTDHLGYGRCSIHGGCAPSGRKNGLRQMALGEAGQLLTECRDIVAGRDTVEALQDLRIHSAGMVMALGTLVDRLSFKSGWHWDTSTDGKGNGQRVIVVEEEGMVGPDHQGDQRAHIFISLYGEWIDRSARIEKVAADLGLAERKVQVDEAIAQVIVAKVLETFAELGQDPTPYVALLAPKLAALDAVNTSGQENTP